MKYYTLVERDFEGGPWHIAFGSHIRSEVTFEMREMMQEVKRKNMKVVSSQDDQASINAAVALLNEGE